MHNEREKGWDEMKAVYKAATLSARIWKTESNSRPSYTKAGSTLYWLRSSSCPCNETTGDATAKRVFVKHRGTRPNPRKLYQEMPESVNSKRGERCVARSKLNSILSTMSQFAQNNIFQQFYCSFWRRNIRGCLYLWNISQPPLLRRGGWFVSLKISLKFY